MIRVYKGYIFKRLFNQWVESNLGGFRTWTEAKDYIDTIKRKDERKALNNVRQTENRKQHTRTTWNFYNVIFDNISNVMVKIISVLTEHGIT